MNGRGCLAVAVILVLFPMFPADAQVHYQPTPTPLVSAENEPWYQAGDPVTHAGNIYYPAGPQVHFMPFEMVRSGMHRGIPLYTRTTIEPLSLVFVPVGRGLMQPYERRRDGDLAGTVGSQAPSFPVTRFGEQPAAPAVVARGPAPRYRAPVFLDVQAPAPAMQVPEPVGTSGTLVSAVAQPLTPVRRPGTANSLFVDYQGTRWFSAGTSTDLHAANLTRIGGHHGFPVYGRAGDAAVYIPISRDAGAPLTRYEKR